MTDCRDEGNGMSKKSHRLIFELIFLTFSIVWAQNAKEIALVIKVTGAAEVKSSDGRWTPIVQGQRLNSGDFIKTGEASLVAIVFTDDKSMIKIRSLSQIQLQGDRKKEGIAKRLLITIGQVWLKIKPKGAGFRMVTPSGVAAVRGTEFYAYVDAAQTIIIGIEGQVELFNREGSVMVTPGKTGTIAPKVPPTMTDTLGLNDWAKTDDTNQSLEIEFQGDDGNKKQVKIRYREGK
jgi:hypothetical protein